MGKSGKILLLLGIALCVIFRVSTGFAYYPPDPAFSFIGDADGDEYMTVLDIPDLETQANVGLCLDFNTMQPNNDDDRWNTCDVDGDGYCTVLDLPYLYKVAYGGIIDQTPFSDWEIDNYNLPLSDNSSGTWIPFQLSVTADPGYGMGATGRPGMIVKVTIDPVGSTTTGKLKGRNCTPNYWGNSDQLNTDTPSNDQCAVGVSISDWINLPAEGLTEDAGDPYGLKVWANSSGTLHLHAEVAAIDSFLIPAFSNDFYVNFPYMVNINCSNPGPNPVNELTAMQCNITTNGTPQKDTANDTCGGTVSGSGPWTYNFTPTEAQGPGNCTAAINLVEDPGARDSGIVNINEVNVAPTDNAPATVTGNELTSIGFNTSPTDPDIPVQTLTSSVVSATGACSNGSFVGNVWSWTPAEAQGPTSCNVISRVYDGVAYSGNKTTHIKVNEVNVAPTDNAPSTAEKYLTGGGSQNDFTFNINPTDPDIPPQTLTCSVVSSTCAGGSLNGCIWEWINAPSDPQCQVVTRVYDGVAYSANKTTYIQDVAFAPHIWFVNKTAGGSYSGTSWENAFSVIQDGVDAASSGDMVWVSEGNYSTITGGGGDPALIVMKNGVEIYGGFSGNENVLYERVIGQQSSLYATGGPVVIGASNARLDGFSIGCGGWVERDFARHGTFGGMENNSVTNLIVTNCNFDGNTNKYHLPGLNGYIGDGGAINNDYSTVDVRNSTFSNNFAAISGGAISNSFSSAFIQNCVFQNNYAADLYYIPYPGFPDPYPNAGYGGAIFNDSSNVSIINSTAVGNSGARHFHEGNWGNALIMNSIFWNNENLSVKDAIVTYSDVQDDYSGNIGNINSNPLFVGSSDFHLLPDSPCIDAGNPDPNYNDKDGSRNDMGAYGGSGKIVSGISFKCSPSSNWANELSLTQCNIIITGGGTPEKDTANDTCGGSVSAHIPWRYAFTPSESQGPGSCVVAVKSGSVQYSKKITIYEVNQNPIWSAEPDNLWFYPDFVYNDVNGVASDSDLPNSSSSDPGYLTCTKSNSTCSFPVDVTGSGDGAVGCNISLTAPPTPETCTMDIVVEDGWAPSKSVTKSITITIAEAAIDCSNPGPNPVDELTEMQCNIITSSGTPEMDVFKDTCGGSISASAPWRYIFTPTEYQGPGNCVAAIKLGSVQDSDTITINEVNQSPTWLTQPANLWIYPNSVYNNVNGAASDSDQPNLSPSDPGYLSCSKSNSTCSFPVDVIGPGNGIASCNISLTAPPTPETCTMDIVVEDGWTPPKSITKNITIKIAEPVPLSIDCSNPGPNPVNELTAMQCNITTTGGGTPQKDVANDTCGGTVSGSGPWTYNFTPTEAQGPGNCTAAVQVVEDNRVKSSGQVQINEVNRSPSWNPVPSNIHIGFNKTYSQFNGHADDSDVPTQTLTCSKTSQTCSFPVTVSGSGSGAVNCAISFTAGASFETCAVNVEVTDSISTIPATVNIYVLLPEGKWFVDGDVTSSGDCMTWETACKTVQEGVNKASSGEQVWVAEGTYATGTTTSVLTMKDGVEIYGGFAGTENQLNQRDITAHPTILDGQNVSYHVVLGASTARIDGFTIKRGYGSTNGGGMYNSSKTNLIIANCTFSGNTTKSSSNCDGGGIYNKGSSPIITNCAFSGNSSYGGGGIYNYSSSSPTITNCTFSGNSAGAAGGGGIYNASSSSPTITNCTFWGNSAGGGGGICNWSSSSPTITNCTFSGNSAQNGGGIYNRTSSAPNIKNCILWNDLAASGTPEIYNSTSTPTVSYNDIKMSPSSVYTGTGNINSDPLFLYVPLFWDITTAAGTTTTIKVANASIYYVNALLSG